MPGEASAQLVWSERGWDVTACWPREKADVERRRQGEDTGEQVRVMELLQVMSLLLKALVFVLLLKALVQVFVLLLLKVSLLKVAEALFLSSPLTRPQTTAPSPRPGGA